ncbi:hypothetical protein [Neisseria sp. Ec49-e6-T10]|uniref:hypothetical protein n=1 Tax=Neisseria sp. Ec49-e6-T10 TaxID=3140744 RepID=UPI003EB9B272
MNIMHKSYLFLIFFTVFFILLIGFGAYFLKTQIVLSIICFFMAFICVVGQMMTIALMHKRSQQNIEKNNPFNEK